MGANLPAVPDRTDWLDPEDDDDISTFTMLGTQKCQDAGSTDTPIDIDVEVSHTSSAPDKAPEELMIHR